jgi:anion-transporting  ArsA/GET3 family ATPase
VTIGPPVDDLGDSGGSLRTRAGALLVTLRVMPARRTTAQDSHWQGVRLHVVTGKGGTGKTTVAAAMALALAAGGRHSLLVEVEGRQGIAALFDTPPLTYDERHLAVAPGGGEVYGIAVDAKAAFQEYLDLFYHLSRAGKLLERIGAVDFATTVAPGMRDVLLIGKVYEAVRRRGKGGPAFDTVVLDAPPTGRITKFLNVNEEVVGLAKVGPVRNQAGSIMGLLRSPQTVVHLVTVLEEMPVQETVDGVEELRAAGLPVGGIVVNLVRDPVLGRRELADAVKGRLDADAVAASLAVAGLGGRSAGGQERLTRWADGLLDEAGEHGERVALERQERRTLGHLERPMYELPALPGGIDLGALYHLAQRLREQGLA